MCATAQSLRDAHLVAARVGNDIDGANGCNEVKIQLHFRDAPVPDDVI